MLNYKEARKGRKPCVLKELGKLGRSQVNLSSAVLPEGRAEELARLGIGES